MGLTELPGGLLPAVNEAMPFRLVSLLGVLREHAGARQVRVLLADYEPRELRLLAPGGGEQLTLRWRPAMGVIAEPAGPGITGTTPMPPTPSSAHTSAPPCAPPSSSPTDSQRGRLTGCSATGEGKVLPIMSARRSSSGRPGRLGAGAGRVRGECSRVADTPKRGWCLLAAQPMCG